MVIDRSFQLPKIFPEGPVIAFSCYSTPDDISGVSSWLSGLITSLRHENIPLAINLHHIGKDPAEGTFRRQAENLGVEVTGIIMPECTEDSVENTIAFLNRTRPKVFCPQALPPPHFAGKILKASGLPWIFTLHSDDPVYWALAEQTAPDASDGVWVAVSKAIADQARQNFPKADIRVIPCGVDIPEDYAIWNETVFRVVYSGRLVEEQKRVSRVVEALILACHGSPLVAGVIVGDGPEKLALMDKVKLEGLGDRIRFTGRLEHAEVKAELLQSQAMIMMSDYEGLPVALLEGMACGLVPIVMSIRSGIPEIVLPGETGILFEGGPAEAASEIMRMAGKEAAWQKLSGNSRNLVARHYSAKDCLSKWHALFWELEQRSKVIYPIEVPALFHLPPLDSRLVGVDCRRLGFWRKVFRSAERRLRRLGSFAKARLKPVLGYPPLK